MTDRKYWFEVQPLKRRRGYITWILGDFIELQDEDTGDYHLVHYSKVELTI